MSKLRVAVLTAIAILSAVSVVSDAAAAYLTKLAKFLGF